MSSSLEIEMKQQAESTEESTQKSQKHSHLRWAPVAAVIVWVMVLLHLTTLSFMRTAAAQDKIAGLQIGEALCGGEFKSVVSCEKECYRESHCCYNKRAREWCKVNRSD